MVTVSCHSGSVTDSNPPKNGDHERDWPRVLRWLRSPPVISPEPQISPARAGIEVALVYVAFFGVGVLDGVLAVFNLITVHSPSWVTASGTALGDVLKTGLAVAVVVLVCQRRGSSASDLGLSFRPLLGASDARHVISR